MPSLQVREMPEPLYSRLVEAARREHRSLAQQAVAVLAKALDQREDAPARRHALLREIDEKPIRPLRPIPDPAEIVREDRRR